MFRLIAVALFLMMLATGIIVAGFGVVLHYAFTFIAGLA